MLNKDDKFDCLIRTLDLIKSCTDADLDSHCGQNLANTIQEVYDKLCQITEDIDSNK